MDKKLNLTLLDRPKHPAWDRQKMRDSAAILKKGQSQGFRLNLFFPSGAKRRLVMVLFLFWLPGLVMSSGCKKTEKTEKNVPPFEIEKVYKRGPVLLTIRASKKEISIAEHLQLVLEVRAQEDYEISLPDFSDKMEQFGVVEHHFSPSRLMKNGMVEYRNFYELEPFLSGDYTIPPMKIRFRQKTGEEKEHVLESEPLSVRVKSLLPENATDFAIKEIRPPLAMANFQVGWFIGIGLVLLGAVCLFGYYVWRQRQNNEEMVTQTPAHEMAHEQLEKLLAENLLEKGEVKLFYLRLSSILRHYIENRFGLRAPERTTEEFLDELRFTDSLVSPHKNILAEFLTHSDMVKFARHQPANVEIQQAFDSCKQFIIETEKSKKMQSEMELSQDPQGENHAV